MRIQFFLIILSGIFCITLRSQAQDKIYFNNGSVLEAKVLKLSPREVTYKRWDNLNGADYQVPRRDLEKIVYENGISETISGSRSSDNYKPTRHDWKTESLEKAGYGKNILSLAPVQMTIEGVSGLGLHYERLLDAHGRFAFYLPVAFSFFKDDYPTHGVGGGTTKNRTSVSFFPGFKFYPMGSGRRVSYSLGASFAISFGEKYRVKNVYDPVTLNYREYISEDKYQITGVLINNGINFMASKHLYLGVEFGLGLIYGNNKEEDIIVDGTPLAQFNFKMGYRF